MDVLENSVSSLEMVKGRIETTKQIISGSSASTAILPDDFVEFTNEDGQREWTNDPDKIASLTQEDNE